MPGHNMLGLEIRQPIIERANKWAASLGLHRAVVFLLWAAAGVWLAGPAVLGGDALRCARELVLRATAGGKR